MPLAYGSERDGDMWLDVPDVASFHLPAAGASLTASPARSVDTKALLDAYYGTALPLFVQAARGLEVLHGSAVHVASRGCVVAFCGTSGAGKSTVGYGLAARGYGHWADDAVAFRSGAARSLTAVGLPFTAKLLADPFPDFQAASDGIIVVDVFAWKPARLGAVVVLEPLENGALGKSAVEVERLSPGEALHALLPHAFRFHPERRERRREMMRAYLELAAAVPVSRARFAHELDRLPELLDGLERWLGRVA